MEQNPKGHTCVWLLYFLLLQWRSSHGCHGPVDGPPTQPACLHHNRNMACVCILAYRNFYCKLTIHVCVWPQLAERSQTMHNSFLIWRKRIVVYSMSTLREEVSPKFQDMRRLMGCLRSAFFLPQSIHGSATRKQLLERWQQLALWE